MDSSLSIIQDYQILIGAVLATLGFILAIRNFLKEPLTKLETSIEKLSGKVEKLEIASLNHSKDIGYHSSAIKMINEFIFQKNVILSKSSSQIALTWQGKALVEKLKAEQLIAGYINDWMDLLKIKQDANKLQIQEACFQFCNTQLLDCVSKAEADEIMEAIFYHGEGRTEITQLYGILLRDSIFKQRGIVVSKTQEKENNDLPPSLNPM